MTLEKTILKNLLSSEDYCRKVLPFIKEEYFSGEDKILFSQINQFIAEYNQRPTVEALTIDIDALRGVSEDEAKACKNALASFDFSEKSNEDWLLKSTEEFCQEKAIYQAMMKAIEIMNDKNGTLQKGAIPSLLTEALSVSFDPNIGHDYFDNADDRFEFYHRVEEKIPFDLEFFNKITKEGLPKKTLNIALAGTGVGKSLFMCHCAAANISAGFNVLYITMEMSEEKIAERIDANLLNVDIADLEKMSKDMYDKKIEAAKAKAHGKLIIKEYPTAAAGANHFRNLLNELRLKRSFVPDIIYIDYLNICSSSRIKAGGNVNSYTYIKSIAEELRGLAVEFNVPLVSATQTTRSGYASSDVELTDTSESFGLPATADLMFALITNETLEQLNQIQVKQLKNRYNDPTSNKRFVIGIDRAKMRLYDVEDAAQVDIIDSGQTPVFEKGNFNNRDKFKKLKVV
jgi:replicative DNA helicase